MCFVAKHNQFDRFQVEVDGSIEAAKLVQLSGQMTSHLKKIKGLCDKLDSVQCIPSFNRRSQHHSPTDVDVSPFRVMVHNPVKLSSVASRLHSSCPLVKNYRCGTKRTSKMRLNLIMMGARELIFFAKLTIFIEFKLY